MESTAKFLQRIALQHSDRKIQAYIKSLELVAQKAQVVVSSTSGDGEVKELKEALENLERVAS